MTDEEYMRIALSEAKLAASEDEVPVGAVIVLNGQIIAQGHNMREQTHSALMHAEIVTIQQACKVLDTWHLDGCEMYVTLEPCPMCAGAIIQSRIKRLIFGAYDPKGGSVETVTRLFDVKEYNHHPQETGGLLADECAIVLKDYFRKKRLKR